MLQKAVRGDEMAETLPINAREPHNALAFKMMAEARNGSVPFHQGLPSVGQMFRAIAMQIEYLQPKAVLLTSEVFANFAGLPETLIARLGQFFKGEDIRVIAALRRVDDYLMSWHSQRLRFGHKLKPLNGGAMGDYWQGIHFDYRKMLKAWIDTLPDAHFVVRNYGDVLAAGGLVEDFMTQSGICFPKKLQPVRKANRSLHHGLFEIARRGNHGLARADALALRQTLTRLTPKLDLPPANEVEMFGAAMRRNLAERFEPVHAYLEQVSGQVPFFPDQDEVRQPRPQAAAAVATTALARLQDIGADIEHLAVRDFITQLDLTA